jgi:hypothetical protein
MVKIDQPGRLSGTYRKASRKKRGPYKSRQPAEISNCHYRKELSRSASAIPERRVAVLEIKRTFGGDGGVKGPRLGA